jgi:hypothetical protein
MSAHYCGKGGSIWDMRCGPCPECQEEARIAALPPADQRETPREQSTDLGYATKDQKQEPEPKGDSTMATTTTVANDRTYDLATVQRAVMNAISESITACAEQRKLPTESWCVDYAAILKSALNRATGEA